MGQKDYLCHTNDNFHRNPSLQEEYRASDPNNEAIGEHHPHSTINEQLLNVKTF